MKFTKQQITPLKEQWDECVGEDFRLNFGGLKRFIREQEKDQGDNDLRGFINTLIDRHFPEPKGGLAEEISIFRMKFAEDIENHRMHGIMMQCLQKNLSRQQYANLLRAMGRHYEYFNLPYVQTMTNKFLHNTTQHNEEKAKLVITLNGYIKTALTKDTKLFFISYNFLDYAEDFIKQNKSPPGIWNIRLRDSILAAQNIRLGQLVRAIDVNLQGMPTKQRFYFLGEENSEGESLLTFFHKWLSLSSGDEDPIKAVLKDVKSVNLLVPMARIILAGKYKNIEGYEDSHIEILTQTMENMIEDNYQRKRFGTVLDLLTCLADFPEEHMTLSEDKLDEIIADTYANTYANFQINSINRLPVKSVPQSSALLQKMRVQCINNVEKWIDRADPQSCIVMMEYFSQCRWKNPKLYNILIEYLGNNFEKLDSNQMISFCEGLDRVGLAQYDIFGKVSETLIKRRLDLPGHSRLSNFVQACVSIGVNTTDHPWFKDILNAKDFRGNSLLDIEPKYQHSNIASSLVLGDALDELSEEQRESLKDLLSSDDFRPSRQHRRYLYWLDEFGEFTLSESKKQLFKEDAVKTRSGIPYLWKFMGMDQVIPDIETAEHSVDGFPVDYHYTDKNVVLNIQDVQHLLHTREELNFFGRMQKQILSQLPSKPKVVDVNVLKFKRILNKNTDEQSGLNLEANKLYNQKLFNSLMGEEEGVVEDNSTTDINLEEFVEQAEELSEVGSDNESDTEMPNLDLEVDVDDENKN